jgi:hypothetical protein
LVDEISSLLDYRTRMLSCDDPLYLGICQLVALSPGAMKLFPCPIWVSLLLCLWWRPATSEYLRALEPSPEWQDVSNTTAVANVGNEDSRLFTVKRCPRSDVCFNNPGFFNGFRMYKISTFRNGYQCKSVCVPTGACLYTACTGNFFFFTLGWKSLNGWDCGTCPKKKNDD